MLGVFLDTETTGLDPYVHSIVEIAFILVDLYTGKELDCYQTLFRLSREDWTVGDSKSLQYVGLDWKDLSVGIKTIEAQQQIEEVFKRFEVARGKAVFICQNPSFDRPFFSKIIPVYRQEELQFPYHWLDLASMYWALIVAKRQTGSEMTVNFSKDTIAKDLLLPPETKPHRALNGARHLLLCYEKLVGYVHKPVEELG